MARYHGKTGVVYMSTTGSGTAINVISLNRWSLNSNTDKAEVTSFGDANKTYVQGLPDISGSLAGWFDDSQTSLYTGSKSADGVKLYLYPSSLYAAKYWYGPAWVDFSIDVGVSGGISISGNFVANGSWGAY